ncbi:MULTISPECIES: branched-chain amino acid ABC transporter permease [unclassified Cupriavidus]|uniref:branched-chain amino acid ABC transporter permease n=1 Tax=unclassified Cupriavidus TaxID=2640874 RepID=UPI00041AD8D0|nr:MULTISPECIES: branched-chain amino acid ABC transporter permease [unclassified Cupriavidus]MBP0633153.1 branched-chain amino acid ABC transporter permease [Cupriavidus sp. AcVe19-1a]
MSDFLSQVSRRRASPGGLAEPTRLPWRGILLALLLLGMAWVVVYYVRGYVAFQFALVVAYAVALMGVQFLIGSSGQISLGHGAFFAIGAYTAAMLIDRGWAPYWLTIPAAGVVGFVAGGLFGMPAVRLSGPYLALATFALALALPQVLKHPALEGVTGGVAGISIETPAPPYGLPLDADQWMLLVVSACALLIYAMVRRLLRGPTGIALRALRDHPAAALAAGVPVRQWRARAFATSAGIVGMAGAMNALLTHFVSPDGFTVLLSLGLVAGVVVGGTGHAIGSLIGALFLVFVPNVAEEVSKAATGLVYGALMLGCVFLAPNGLAGLLSWCTDKLRSKDTLR